MSHLRKMREYLKPGACDCILFLFICFCDLKCEESVRVTSFCTNEFTIAILILVAPDYGCQMFEG